MAPKRILAGSSALAVALVLAAGPAAGDRVAPPPHSPRMVRPVPPPVRAHYPVQLIAENGSQMQTYARRGRSYVLGQAGQRYTIKVSNPTNRRVEAVVSVDGLDVIDGKSANFRTKRGYVVPPHGDLQIDGFRVSSSQVAAFRFSSVSNSYAGRKGKARNVGVIGVAIFEERAQPEIIVRRPYPVRPHHPYWGRSGSKADEASKPAAKRAPASPRHSPEPTASASADSAGGGSVTGGMPAPPSDVRHRPAPPPRTCYRCTAQPTSRPGLGTKWGEYRHSNVSWTRFVRANASQPSVITTMHYNDVSGLQALGIRVHNTYVSQDELSTRETANPFPGTGYARPPQ